MGDVANMVCTDDITVEIISACCSGVFDFVC